MTDTALVAVVLAAAAGFLAARARRSALRRGDPGARPFGPGSPHFAQGLHYLVAGRTERAISELAKVAREEPEALELRQLLGNLLREAGQVERAMQVHQALLGRHDLARSERSYLLACLGMDQRAAGFIDRATSSFEEALEADPRNIHALAGLQKLHEEQRRWHAAYDAQLRLARLRKSDDGLVLGFLQAEIGREAAVLGRRDEATRAFRAALALDRRVFPAYLGLAALELERDPRQAALTLEDAVRTVPERAYLAFDLLARAYAACGEPSRLVTLCEGLLQQDQRDWRARLALARHLRGEGKPEEAIGLLLRALEANPQVLLVHLETWRTLRALGLRGEAVERYVAAAEAAVFYRDPHICTVCRYRADDMLWRCPHCHEWNTFVEERVGPGAAGRPGTF